MRSLLDWYQFCTALNPVQPRYRITREEVALHSSKEDCWCIIEGKVYNLKAYLEFHPGGEKILRSVYGKDATELFIKNHRWVNYENLLEKLFVGYVEN